MKNQFQMHFSRGHSSLHFLTILKQIVLNLFNNILEAQTGHRNFPGEIFFSYFVTTMTLSLVYLSHTFKNIQKREF